MGRFLPWLKEQAHMRLGPRLRENEDTDDFVQDALRQFLTYGPPVRVDRDDYFRGLLRKILENRIRDKNDWFQAERRNRARERPFSSDTVLYLDPPVGKVKTPSEIVDQDEHEALIRLGIECLDPEDQKLIVWRNWHDETFVEIATKLDSTPNAIVKRYSKSLERLRLTVESLLKGKIPPTNEG
jgi:RNA polymerase sigma factor (sigma-70 family)